MGKEKDLETFKKESEQFVALSRHIGHTEISEEEKKKAHELLMRLIEEDAERRKKINK